MAIAAADSIAVESLSDVLLAVQNSVRTRKNVELLFSWARLRAVGIGYAMAIVAKARAAYPQALCRAVLDVGEDAGLALSALRSGADLVLFSGPPQMATKLASIAAQMGVGLELYATPLTSAEPAS